MLAESIVGGLDLVADAFEFPKRQAIQVLGCTDHGLGRPHGQLS